MLNVLHLVDEVKDQSTIKQIYITRTHTSAEFYHQYVYFIYDGDEGEHVNNI